MPNAVASPLHFSFTANRHDRQDWRVLGAKVLLASVAVALAAHVAFPLPFTPVPLTLQPLAVLCTGLALGPAGGFVAMLCYLLEGAMGLPVFSPTGPGGMAQLLGPTGGFLLAYPLVAAISGGVTRSLRRYAGAFLSAAVACSAAVCILFLSGAGWLMLTAHLTLQATWIAAVACSTAVCVLFFSGAGWLVLTAHLTLQATWVAAVAPFLPGETVKVLVAAGLYRTLAARPSR